MPTPPREKSGAGRFAELAREIARLGNKVSRLETRGPPAHRPHARASGLVPLLVPAGADLFATELTGSIPFVACDKFYENTTEGRVTKTVTICNDDSGFEMQVDIDGTEVTTIDPGKCKTIVVSIPARKSLHADHDGRYRPEP